jgi:transposase
VSQPINAQPVPVEPDDLPDDAPTLKRMVRELLATVAVLQEQVQTLTERLDRNSSNSSRPPSSDPPWRERERKPPTGKKRGGQPGHRGRHREVLPPDQVDHVQKVLPPACAHCGDAFPSELPRRVKYRRHQVVELPEIRPVVTEYQLYARRCRCCGRRTWATLPPGVKDRCVGPRVQAITAILSGACRLSRRQVQTLLADLFGVKIALGTVSALEADTVRALAAPYQEVAEAVPRRAALGVDETSWREAGVLHWLWTAACREFVFYRVDRHRNRAAFAALLGLAPDDPLPDTLFHTDRFSAYGHLPPERRSFCLAHLAREFRAVWERGGVDRALGSWLLDVTGSILEPWHAHRTGKLTREAFVRAVKERREELRFPLRWGSQSGSRKTQTLCRSLLGHWGYLWAWLEVEEGEPTNNAAERALRPAVLWRKNSFGHQSAVGEQFVERMLTVVGTLRLQQRNLWEFLVAACEAEAHGRPAPKLLTQPAS